MLLLAWTTTCASLPMEIGHLSKRSCFHFLLFFIFCFLFFAGRIAPQLVVTMTVCFMHTVAMIRMRRTVGQRGHATEGAGQGDRKSLPSVRSVFVHLSDVGTVEVVVYSTLVGVVTCFRTWLKKRNICAFFQNYAAACICIWFFSCVSFSCSFFSLVFLFLLCLYPCLTVDASSEVGAPWRCGVQTT